MSPTDMALVRRWTDGRDAEAFAELVRRHSAMVYGTCRRILGNAADAEEVVQDCFLKLAQARSPIRSSLAGWLHTVATHRSINRIKADTRRREREMRYVADGNTRATVEWDDVIAFIDEAIAALPETLRCPIITHFLEGRTHEAIAGTLGVSQSTVTRRIQKGVDEVRKSLRRRGVSVATSALAALLATNGVEAAPATLASALGKIALAGAGNLVPAAPAGTVAIGTGATLVGALVAMKAKTMVVIAVAALLLGVGVYIGMKSGRRPEPISPVSENAAYTSKFNAESLEIQRANLPAGAPSTSSDETTRFSGEASGKDAAVVAEEPEAEPPTSDEPEPEDQYASISGYVVDDGGYPVPGAAVTVPFGVDAFGASVDSLGLYSIKGITGRGNPHVYVNAQGFRTASKQVTLEPRQALKNVDFILSKGVTLNGRVVTADANPVPFARVQHHASISASGHGGFYVSVAFTGADRSGMKVSGRVTGERTGRPLTSIRIAYLLDGQLFEGSGMPGEDQVRRDGSYELRLYEPGTYLIFPKYYGWSRDEMAALYGKEVRWSAGDEIVVNFELPEHVTRTVRALDTEGNPIENAEVKRYTRLPDGASSMHGVGYTDENGEYSWSGFAPMCESWFRVHKEGYTPAETTRVVGEPGAVYPIEQVVLLGSGGVEGRLVDPDGNPIANTNIALKMTPTDGITSTYSDGDGVFVETRTDSDGRFAVAQGLPATTGRLVIFDAPPYSGASMPIECVAGYIVDLGEIVLAPKR